MCMVPNREDYDNEGMFNYIDNIHSNEIKSSQIYSELSCSETPNKRPIAMNISQNCSYKWLSNKLN